MTLDERIDSQQQKIDIAYKALTIAVIDEDEEEDEVYRINKLITSLESSVRTLKILKYGVS